MKKTKKVKKQTVEIAASWSFKLNISNYLTIQELQYLDSIRAGVNYQGIDWFLSQKKECKVGEEEVIAEALEQFCRATIMKAVNRYIAEVKAMAQPPKVKTNDDFARETFESMQN
jgi:hypothetical protein